MVTSVKYTSALGKTKIVISQGPLVERYRILPVCLRALPWLWTRPFKSEIGSWNSAKSVSYLDKKMRSFSPTKHLNPSPESSLVHPHNAGSYVLRKESGARRAFSITFPSSLITKQVWEFRSHEINYFLNNILFSDSVQRIHDETPPNLNPHGREEDFLFPVVVGVQANQDPPWKQTAH